MEHPRPDLTKRILDIIRTSQGELELILKVSSAVSEEFGVEKVNFLIDYGDAKNFDPGKTGFLLPLDTPDPGVPVAWQIPHPGGIEITDALREKLVIAGQLLLLALQNLALKQQTIVDGLTKVYNRAHFDHCLNYEMERSRRYNTPFSLLILDVDKFKTFNDIYGHQKGDEVLKIVAQTLKENTRASDMVFRYGGEEFAVILPHADQKKAEQVAGRVKIHIDATVRAAERLRECIGQHPLKHGEQWIPITVSVGLAVHTGTESEITSADLIQRADDALYRAKDRGRNRSEVIGKEERLSILVVDDEEDYCQLLTDYFEKRGYEVVGTTSGRIATELLHNNEFHLVLLDLNMPGISGMDLLKKIQNSSKHKKIVVITGVHDESIKQLCYDYGVCEYLEKPISIEYIDKTLMARILEMKA